MFVLAYKNSDESGRIYINSPRAYALPRVKLTKFNVLIDGLGYYDNPVSSEIKKYEEVLKVKTIQQGVC